MPKVVSKGPIKYIFRSWALISFVSAKVAIRRFFRGPLAPSWSYSFEIGVLFWRGQFQRAMAMDDIQQGRIYFDSLQTYTDEVFQVERCPTIGDDPKGDWITPETVVSSATILYFHGGGYTFNAAISHWFTDLIAAKTGAKTFAVNHRLTPENPHPAQIYDALQAYRYLLESGVKPENLVVMGDSAGGHLALMLIVALRTANLPQPALVIGLCPWTDIGARGTSLFGNNPTDLVQGDMALQFGRWLVGGDIADVDGETRQLLSPIAQNYIGLAPIYLQAGGAEVLVDMIRDFATELQQQGCDVMFDVWPDMTHVFQAHGETLSESQEAFTRMNSAIRAKIGMHGKPGFEPCPTTEIITQIMQ